MQHLIALLKPDWRKVLVSALLLVFLAAAYIQTYAFVDDVPGTVKPPLYDLLRPFNFWTPAMLLLAPLTLSSAPLLQWPGFASLSSSLMWPLQISYVYSLSCLLIFGRDHWGRQIKRWHWIILIPPIFVAAALWISAVPTMLRSPREMIPFFVSSALFSGCILLLYLYIAVYTSIGVCCILRNKLSIRF